MKRTPEWEEYSARLATNSPLTFELIDGDDSSQFCCLRGLRCSVLTVFRDFYFGVSVVVYGQFCTTFDCCNVPLNKGLGPQKNWVTALSELQHHHFCLRVPFSIWFVMESPIPLFLVSGAEKQPASFTKLACVL